MKKSRLLTGLRGGQSGTALLEMAIVLPVSVALFIGVIDVGRAYFTRATGEKSIRAAVRYMTTLPASGVCPVSGTPPAWGVVRATNLALYGNIQGTGNVRIANWGTGNFTVTSTACPVAPGATIKISATVPFTAVGWQYMGLPATLNMTVQHEEKWIGQ